MGRARTVSVCLTLVLATSAAIAQCGLTTTFSGSNNAKGCMFDVVATQSINVTGFQQNLPGGSHNLQIYTKAGSWIGFQNTPSAWTLIGSATGVTSAGLGIPTPIPITTNWSIAPSSTRAFYITSSGTTNIAYSNGTSVGSVAAQDGY